MLGHCAALAHLDLRYGDRSGDRNGAIDAVSIRHTSAHVSTRQHTSAYVSICPHSSACVIIRHYICRRARAYAQRESARVWICSVSLPPNRHCSADCTIRSVLSGKRGFELRGVVKPLTFVCRHPALLALCQLYSRQASRKSDILYTYSVVAFGLALSL